MNSGKANKAAIRLVLWSGAVLVGIFVLSWVGHYLGGFIIAYPLILVGPWALFLMVVLYLFRDPNPIEPTDPNAIVSPAHGKVDVIAETVESEFMKGACKRISIRVSLLDVQVQNAPVAGTLSHFHYQPAMNESGTTQAENLLIGFDVVGRPAVKIGLRLIAGQWGKRIMPWVQANDVVSRSVRIGMMRPASRVDLYLPATAKLHVNSGDEVVGGQSVVARFE